MLAFISSWLTPASLFLVLNLVIGTIAITTRFASHRKPQQEYSQDHHHYHHQLGRAPSLIDRVRSFNFSLYKFPSTNLDTDHHNHFEPTTEPEHTSPVDPNPPPPLARVPSFLERVKSINFSLYKFPSTNLDTDSVEPEHVNRVDPDYSSPLSRTPSLLDRVKSNLSSLYRSDSNKSTNPQHEIDTESDPDEDADSEHDEDHHIYVKRSKSESKTRTERVVPEKMKKSASEKPRLRQKSAEEEDEDEDEEEVERRHGDVDAKADDFINKFKQQLKLQRLDSLLRYKDMVMGKGR